MRITKNITPDKVLAVLYNASSHLTNNSIKILEYLGAKFLFNAPNSPRNNMIEYYFNNLKIKRR